LSDNEYKSLSPRIKNMIASLRNAIIEKFENELNIIKEEDT